MVKSQSLKHAQLPQLPSRRHPWLNVAKKLLLTLRDSRNESNFPPMPSVLYAGERSKNIPPTTIELAPRKRPKRSASKKAETHEAEPHFDSEDSTCLCINAYKAIERILNHTSEFFQPVNRLVVTITYSRNEQSLIQAEPTRILHGQKRSDEIKRKEYAHNGAKQDEH